MHPLSFAILGVALANEADPVATVRQQVLADGSLYTVAACAPLGRFAEVFDQLPDELTDSWASGLLGPVLDGARTDESAEQRGIDRSGALVFVPDDAGAAPRLLRVPFLGSTTDAEQFVQGLAGQRPTSFAMGWTFEAADVSVDVNYAWSSLLFRRRTSLEPPPQGVHPLVLDDLPTGPGCAVWLRPWGSAASPMPSLAVHVPADGDGPLTLRLEVPDLNHEQLRRPLAAPIAAASVAIPNVVVSIGVNPEPLRTLMNSMGMHDEKLIATLESLPRLAEAVRLAPGMTVAFFGSPQTGAVVAAMRLAPQGAYTLPPTIVVQNMQTPLRAAGWTVEETGVARLQLTRGGNGGHLLVRDGLLYFGTRPELVEDAASGHGTPWMEPAMQAAAGTSVLAVHARDVWDDGRDWLFGLREHPVGLELTVSATDRSRRSAMVIALGWTLHEVRLMNLRILRAELVENVNGLKTAVAMYDAAFDGYISAPPAPRPVHALTPDEVPWRSTAEFVRLGWSPDGPVRGTYWIEVAPDGSDFEVYGAMDADGDGEPVVYRATNATNATRWRGTEDEF